MQTFSGHLTATATPGEKDAEPESEERPVGALILTIQAVHTLCLALIDIY